MRVVLGGCGAAVVCHEHGASPWAESEIRGEAARSRDPPGAEPKQDPGLGSPPPAGAGSVVVGSMVVQH